MLWMKKRNNKLMNGYEPTVSVSTKKNNGKVEIKVKDNGNGIPQKVLDKIFQPFFTTKPTGQGTGLGLSLSYDIVKAHGGELKVETKEGEGSEFIIHLPVDKIYSMKLVKIVLYILLPVFSMAQVNPLFLEPTKEQADSLRKALNENINDTLRMAANRELALFYLDINADSALFYIEKDLPLARKLQLKLWEADALDLMGIISNTRGNYVKAIKSINEALQIVESKECEKNIWNISKFTNSGMPEFARLSMLGTIHSDVSGIYGNTGNYDKQLNSVQECIKTATG